MHPNQVYIIHKTFLQTLVLLRIDKHTKWVYNIITRAGETADRTKGNNAMKALNTIQFVVNCTTEIEKYKARIRNAEDFEKARRTANALLGYIDCTITFLNTMVCMENNDFTAEFDEVIEQWQRDMYQALADKAIETKQDNDCIIRLLQKRDEVAA